MTYTKKEKAILTRGGNKPMHICYSRTRGEYRKNLDEVIKRAVIEELENLNDEDGAYTNTIKGIQEGNQEALEAGLDGVKTMSFEELNIIVFF